MSQAIACGCNPPRLVGIIDACGSVVGSDNPLTVKTDYQDNWGLIDEASDTVTYVGFPVLSPDDTDPLCAIMEIRTTGTVTTRKWAGGTMDKLHAWSDRAILEYLFLS
jgi:hypothetical protein